MSEAGDSSVAPPPLSRPKGPISQREQARSYLEDHSVLKMFESLMAGLMMQRPDDHLGYLDTKLEEIKEIGIENVNWESFVQDMHPQRSAQRQEVIHDAYWEKQQKIKEIQEKWTQKNEDMTPENTQMTSEMLTSQAAPAQTQSDLYKPEVFNLTEAVDS